MRALPYMAAVLVGCASVPAGPPPPPPEQAFRGVKGVALVHRVDWKGAEPGPGESRRRDPLDALQGALASRGLATVTVELPDRPSADLADVDALARLVEWSAPGGGAGGEGPAVGSVGGKASPVLEKLGVEALAVYVRGSAFTAPPSPFFGQPLAEPLPGATSAIGLVARDGTVVTFAWGGGLDPWGSAGPANAAEAVDAALALLVPPAE